MSNPQTSTDHSMTEPVPATAHASAGKGSAVNREQPSARMVKRGDTRRRLEDLMLSRETQDLW